MNSTNHPTVRIASRGSDLAMWQARYVADQLKSHHVGLNVEIVEVSTTGDQVLNQPLRDFGGLGVFTREVQHAVLDGRADLAVHSLKDLPTEVHPELILAAIPERGLTADALVLPANTELPPLLDGLCVPRQARIATGSPRRQAQLLRCRPDVQLLEVRGNVITRLKKLDAGEFDAMVLATAGLTRLGLGHRISQVLEAPLMYHAVGQGALGIECRRHDVTTLELLAPLTDVATRASALAERRLLSQLRAGCHAPVGVTSRLDGDHLQLEAVVLTLHGEQRWTAAATGPSSAPEEVGAEVARLLLAQGAQLGE